MNKNPALPPLAVGKNLTDIGIPFENDLLDRKKLADKLTGYIDRLAAGAVIAIDAPWGEGKTWFGKNWAKQLENDHRVIYLDAFKGDYMDDPFLLISAEITRLLDKNGQSDFKLKIARAMNLLLPIGKTAFQIAAGTLTGIPDITAKTAHLLDTLQAAASDSTERLIQKKIEEYIAEESSLTAFRNRLASIASTEEKPIVFFIDELDRCSPVFAIALLERIKHFFEVPNLVFVLLIHRDQLYEAIRGVYGQNTDAVAYLHKFVHLFMTLPVHRLPPGHKLRLMQKFIATLLTRHKIDSRNNIRYLFVEHFSLWAYIASLTLRDMEKGVALYLLADHLFTHPDNFFNINLFCFLIVLKLQHPQWLDRILDGDGTLYAELQTNYFSKTELSRPIHKEIQELLSHCIELFHKALVEYDPSSIEELKRFINELDLSV